MIKDLRTFSGGLDFDTDDRAIANTDYKYGMCLATGVSDRGAVTNMLGSIKIDYTLPDGNNTVIGTLRNIKENSIIYFVFNDLLNHSILEYKCLDKIVEPILEPRASIGFTTEFLGFTIENKIHSANILDDILTWTDNNVSPRKINKKRAKDFLNQLTPSADNIPYDNLLATGTFEEKVQFIELIKYKPQRAISTIETDYDPTRNTNYIINRMVQMKYRYIYDDNEISRWSDATPFTLPVGGENANGTISLKTNNNFVRCYVNTGHPTVKNIDVAFRFSDRGIWARLDEPIKKYNNNNQRLINDYETYEVLFYNDSVLVEVTDEVDNYDTVPLKAATQDIIDGNILVLANTEEGYENPEIDVVTTPILTSIAPTPNEMYAGDKTPSTTKFTIASQDSINGGPLANPNTRDYRPLICIPLSSTEITLNSVISFKFRTSTVTNFATSVDYNISFTIIQNDLTNWPINFTNRLRSTIASVANPTFTTILNADGGSATTSVPLYNGVAMQILVLQDWTFAVSQYTTIEDFAITSPTKKEVTLKSGAYHPFGIVYRDLQGRDGGVVTNEDMVLYVPYVTETQFKGGAVPLDLKKYRPQFEIKHTPPLWAHTYEIVYAGNNLKKYTQFVLKGTSIVVLPNGNFSLNCDYIVDYISKDIIQTSLDFQFEKGDRLRFIQNADNYVSEYIECQVLDYDTATNNLTVVPFDTSIVTNTMSPFTIDGTLVELFAYNEVVAPENRPYFAIGNIFSILDAGTSTRRHAGNQRNQSPTQSAISILNFGDSFTFTRFFNKGVITSIVESENFSDFYPSNNIGISSIYAVIPNGKTKRYEQLIRHGGRYFQNTNVNNLCRFSSDDFDILNAMYGPINKVVTMGYTLKCLQTKKNTSIYIGRNMVFNANGSSQLSLTDKVFGDKNPSELDYGCANPESVCVDDRQMYFFDVNTGTIIQDSANGMMPISDYKARTYWRNVADTIKNIPGIYVYSGVDNFNKYVHFTIQDTNETRVIDDQTIVYHEDENRWKSFMPYTPEYYGSNAMVFVSFKDGELWEQNSVLVPRNNFFGEQYNSEIELISNIEYPTVKVFNTIAVYANKVFYSPNVGDIKTIANGNYSIGMISRLLKSKFRAKEGVFYADYLRDANTPNMSSQDVAIMEGRKLRGEFLLHKLINDDTDKVVLYSVIVGSVKSDKSG
jgi:hypothetical protein